MANFIQSLRKKDDSDSEVPEEEEQEVVEDVKMITRSLIMTMFISAFGSSTQYGYNEFLITYPTEHLKNFFNATYQHRNVISIDESLLVFHWGMAICLYPVGGICGSLLAGTLVDLMGRKKTLLANSMLDIIAAALVITSKPMFYRELLTASRFFFGVYDGISYSVVPIYLAEIAPQRLRGILCTVPDIFISIGSLLAHIVGHNDVLGTEEGWPILLSLGGVPAVIQLYTLPFLPESPRYLFIQRKREEAARKALRELRDRDDVEYEIEELRREDHFEKAEKNMNVSKMFLSRALRWHLLAIIILMCGQQFSGIYPAHLYVNRIFLSVGTSKMAVWNVRLVIYTFLTSLAVLMFVTIDFVGRKNFLLTGLSICSMSCIFLAIFLELQNSVRSMSYLSSSFVATIFIGYTIGPGPIPKVLIAELFLQSSRSTAFVIAGCIHWFCRFFFTLVYFCLETEPEVYSFLLCWPFSIATLLYVHKVIPETKDRSFLEIRQLMDAQPDEEEYLWS